MGRSRLLLPLALFLLGCQDAPPGAPGTPEPSPRPSPDAWQHVNPDAPDKVLVGTMLLWEDFETDLSRWRIEGEAGPARWLRLEGNFCGGAFTMLFGQADRAEFGSGSGSSTLTLTAPLDLREAKRPHLRYDVRGISYPQDAILLQAEARRPGGEWSTVGPGTVARYPAEMGYRYADLTPYAGGEVEIRFKTYLSALERPTRGLMLDDVKVLEPANL